LKKIKYLLSGKDELSGVLKKNNATLSAVGKRMKESEKRIDFLNKKLGKVEEARRAGESYKNYEQRLKTARDELTKMASRMDAARRPTRVMRESYNRAARSVRTLERETEKARKKMDDTRAVYGPLERSGTAYEKTVRKIADEKKRLVGVMKEEVRQAQKIKQYQQKHNEYRRAAADFVHIGGAMQRGGRTLLRVPVLPLAEDVAFEKAMSRVEARVIGGMRDRIQRKKIAENLSGLALDIGGSEVFKSSEAARMMDIMGAAGFSPDQIQEQSRNIIAGARAMRLGLERTVAIGASAVNQYGMDMNKISDVFSVLVKSANKAQFDIEDMAVTLNYTGADARKLNMDLGDTAGLMIALAKNGLKASKAGTGLRGIMSRLAAPTAQAKKVLHDLGIATKDQKGNLRDLTDILREYGEKTEKMGTAKKSEYAKILAKETGATAFKVLVSEAMKDVEFTDKKGRKIIVNGLRYWQNVAKDNDGILRRMNSILSDNNATRIDLLTSAFEKLNITMGKKFRSELGGSLSMLTGVLNKVTELIDANPRGSKALMVGAGVAGATMTVAGGVATSKAIGKMLGMKGLLGLGGRALARGTIYGAVAVALVDIAMRFKVVQDAASDASDAIKKFFNVDGHLSDKIKKHTERKLQQVQGSGKYIAPALPVPAMDIMLKNRLKLPDVPMGPTTHDRFQLVNYNSYNINKGEKPEEIADAIKRIMEDQPQKDLKKIERLKRKRLWD